MTCWTGKHSKCFHLAPNEEKKHTHNISEVRSFHVLYPPPPPRPREIDVTMSANIDPGPKTITYNDNPRRR